MGYIIFLYFRFFANGKINEQLRTCKKFPNSVFNAISANVRWFRIVSYCIDAVFLPWLGLAAPEGGSEQHNQGEDFETTGQHKERHHPFPGGGNEIKRAGDARHSGAQAVVGGAGNR